MSSVELTGETFPTVRMEALSDGVFAIAMTLLILDIKVQDFGDLTTSAQLYDALLNEGPTLLSFIISFLLLGSLWAVHMRQLSLVEKTDRHLTMINTIRLLLVVFVPFTTSVSGAYPEIVLARILLPLNFLLIAIVSYWQWTYAISTKSNLAPNVDNATKRSAATRNIMIILGASLVLLLAPFVGQWAFLVFAILPFAAPYIEKIYMPHTSTG